MTVHELRKMLETVPEDYRVEVQAVWRSAAGREHSCLAYDRVRVSGHLPRERDPGRVVIVAESRG